MGKRAVLLTLGVPFILSACTSIAPVASPSVTSPTPSATIAVTSPSAQAVASPSTAPPVSTPQAGRTAKPPKASTPVGPTAANLIISKFVLDADQLSVGQATDARLTVKNNGSATAEASTVTVTYVDDTGGSGALPESDIDEVEAGGSVQLQFPVAVDHAGIYTFTANADWYDDVLESDEDDNSKDVQATAVSLPNLAFAPGGFTFTLDEIPANGYQLQLIIANTGTAGVVDPFKVGLTYYTGASDSGTLMPYDCCTYELLPIIAAGSTTAHLSYSGYQFTPGDYIIYAFLDDGRVIDESNEEDNEERFDLHVP